MTQVLLLGIAPHTAHQLTLTLESNGCSVSTLPTSELDAGLQTTEWQLAVIGDISSSTGQSPLASLAKAMPVIVVPEHGAIPDAVRAIRQGAYDYLPVPVDPDIFMASVERALIERRTHAQNKTDPRDLPLVGDSPAMRELKDRVRAIATSHRPVLITGEPGSGKRLIARVIHDASTRNLAPMVVVNCATVPASALEGELFGRDPSLSGHSSRGLVAAAHEGTLFLDEIGVLSQEIQARLLRLLTTGELRAVGSANSTRVNVRILASTRMDLEQLSTQGRFRSELLYHLSVNSMRIPPLRERHDDVILLANWLLEQASLRLKRRNLKWSAGAIECIQNYAWPGNVRELENAVERAVILSTDELIPCELLPIDRDLSIPATPVADAGEQTTLEDYFVRFVVENEEHYTETELAEKLGISRKSLWERRQRLNIPRKRSKVRGQRQASEHDPDVVAGI